MKKKLIKIFSFGKVYNQKIYEDLQALDAVVFDGESEFTENREWWVILENKRIVAYCGSGYKEDICHFVRAWVAHKHRGKGWQKRMIRLRLRNAKNYYTITYTSIDNVVSANNLISCGFRPYRPEYKWAGSSFNYWRYNG